VYHKGVVGELVSRSLDLDRMRRKLSTKKGRAIYVSAANDL
jgi:hypothetical protein